MRDFIEEALLVLTIIGVTMLITFGVVAIIGAVVMTDAEKACSISSESLGYKTKFKKTLVHWGCFYEVDNRWLTEEQFNTIEYKLKIENK